MEKDHIIITIMSGREDGRHFKISKFPAILGRHPDDDVFLPHDQRVSRHHAQITREGEEFFLEDIGAKGEGSKNGTYLNGYRINSKTSISVGDFILLGSVWLRFE